MTNTLTLAARLRELDNARLAALISARAVSAAGVHDFFDLADAMLERESVQRALSRLDRRTLAAVAAAAEVGRSATLPQVVDRLVSWGAQPEPQPDSVANRLRQPAELMLLDPGAAAVYDVVREVLAGWPERGLPSGAELAASAPPGVPEPARRDELERTDRLASERAFAAVMAVTELIAELTAEPALELQKGGLALPSLKRLSAALSMPLADLPGLLSIAARAGLVARAHRDWLATDAGHAWGARPTAERWGALVGAWLQTLPHDIRELMRGRAHAPWGESLQALIEWSFPAGGDGLRGRVAEFTRDAELLGLTAADAPSGAGSALLESGVVESAQLMAHNFPPEVDRVYLQHDLSIVAPGPVQPDIDARLRTVADAEGRALAFTYRVSESSVNRAIAAGDTAEGLLEFLSGISLTGVPQPLEYLIGEAVRRFGLVRVGALAEDHADSHDTRARSYVRSNDQDVLHTLQVDQSLGALALTQGDEGRLLSRFGRDEVYWALADARYPVGAEDANGTIVSLRRGRTAPPRRHERRDFAAELVATLRGAEAQAGDDAARAWLARQLDIAVRGRVALMVSVVMPDGRAVDYALEPTGVGGGRLRGRDRTVDIERTFPLSSISGIRPVDAIEA